MHATWWKRRRLSSNPTSYALISAEEFEDMKSGDQEIGFAFFKVDTPSTPNTQHSTPQKGFAEDLQALLSKYGYSAGPQQELDVATGKLTLEQINLIYKHLPVDISFVDENELVKFYSDTDHRISQDQRMSSDDRCLTVTHVRAYTSLRRL